MADLVPLAEDAVWEDQIHQRPIGEPLTGGPPNLAQDEGFANVQAQQLAKRTSWLKQRFLDFGIGTDTTAYTVTDADLALKGGFWTGNDVLNVPSNLWVMGLTAMRAAGQTGMQICTSSVTRALYQRTRFNGAWTPWTFMGNPSVSAATPNAIGCFVFAKSAVGVSYGDPVAGSSLTPADHAASAFGSVLPGTWRALGRTSANGATLFVRTL